MFFKWLKLFLNGLYVFIGDKEYISTEKESEVIFESCYNGGK